MSERKDSWKQTGVGLGHAFRGLSKMLIKTGKKGVDKEVLSWTRLFYPKVLDRDENTI
ncbi:MAG: hypothetical protein IJV48_00935 [Ruminococcus sp.]|nr:hypothetical protein [Ruminococcus sp.]